MYFYLYVIITCGDNNYYIVWCFFTLHSHQSFFFYVLLEMCCLLCANVLLMCRLQRCIRKAANEAENTASCGMKGSE